ncbi:MAG: LemA family protein, partial [bacterium]
TNLPDVTTDEIQIREGNPAEEILRAAAERDCDLIVIGTHGFGRIAEAREKFAGARTIPEKINGANAVESALSRLLVVVENYPNLKSNESFHRLMDELAGTENRIAVERMRYNDTVKTYNTGILRFPGRIFAGLFGFEKGTYYQMPEEEKIVPKVEF